MIYTHVKRRRSRRSNPRSDMKKYLLIGGGVVLAFIAYKKLKGSASGAMDSTLQKSPKATALKDAMGLADLPPGKEYHRYQAVRRGPNTVCWDRHTRQLVDTELCERELLDGLGGIFG